MSTGQLARSFTVRSADTGLGCLHGLRATPEPAVSTVFADARYSRPPSLATRSCSSHEKFGWLASFGVAVEEPEPGQTSINSAAGSTEGAAGSTEGAAGSTEARPRGQWARPGCAPVVTTIGQMAGPHDHLTARRNHGEQGLCSPWRCVANTIGALAGRPLLTRC
jgi:hypothetical protein